MNRHYIGVHAPPHLSNVTPGSTPGSLRHLLSGKMDDKCAIIHECPSLKLGYMCGCFALLL